MRDAMMCPFCRTEAPLGGYAGAQMCGGSFTDREHPGTVRMLLVELDAAGELLPGGRAAPRRREGELQVSVADDRAAALGELYVECPRGHETHIAWLDRRIAAGDVLEPDERAAVHRFTWGDLGVLDVALNPVADVGCQTCQVKLHGQPVQGRAVS